MSSSDESTPVVVTDVNIEADAVVRTADFWAGFDAYVRHDPYEELPTTEHKNGWRHANVCEAATLDYAEYVHDSLYHPIR